MNQAKLQLVISTIDDELIKSLLLDEVDTKTKKIHISDDCWLEPLQSYQPKSSFIETPEIIGFTINFLSNVSVGILAAWLYEKLRGKKQTQAEIDKKKVDLNNQKSIETLIITTVKYEKRNK